MILFLLTFLVNWALIDYVLYVIHFLYPYQVSMLWPWMQALHMPITVNTQLGLLAALLLMATILISYLTPVHQAFVWLEGGRRPSPEERELLAPAIALLEAQSGLSLSAYRFYVRRDYSYNAFAIGRHCITVHSALLEQFSAEETAAILAHELGHLKLHHTSFGLAIYAMNHVANLFLRLYLLGMNALLLLLSMLPFLRILAVLIGWFLQLQFYLLRICIYLPQRLYNLLTNRRQEYAADAYAASIGLGQALASALWKLEEASEFSSLQLSFFQTLWADHPATEKRIQKLSAETSFEKESNVSY